MKRWIRRIIVGGLVAFGAIQFVPVTRSNPPVESEMPMAPEVKAVLRRACYDCHSHETVWPWYSQVAPLSWLISHDVHEGRAELNFSTWQRYNPQEQMKKRKESWDEVHEGAMPPWAYRVLHPEARLSEQDRALLQHWALQR